MPQSNVIDWERSEPVILRGARRNGWAYSRESALANARAASGEWFGWPWIPTGEIVEVQYHPKKGETATYLAEVWLYHPKYDGLANGAKRP